MIHSQMYFVFLCASRTTSPTWKDASGSESKLTAKTGLGSRAPSRDFSMDSDFAARDHVICQFRRAILPALRVPEWIAMEGEAVPQWTLVQWRTLELRPLQRIGAHNLHCVRFSPTNLVSPRTSRCPPQAIAR